MTVKDILNEREKTHGDYEEVANLAYDMKKAIDSHLSFDRKGPDDNNKVLKKKHLISINMILLKIARIICGDPKFADHWDDIAGYAMLGKGKAKGVFGAGEPCKCPNKRRKYFTDTAYGLKTIMTVNYCDECNKMHIVDCEQKEESKEEYESDYLCDYDPSNCEICGNQMTPWSNATWKLHKKDPLKKERCKACKSKSCCDEDCPLNSLSLEKPKKEEKTDYSFHIIPHCLLCNEAIDITKGCFTRTDGKCYCLACLNEPIQLKKQAKEELK